ncbi:hypothetical protein CP532_4191 [Ophiocordyceps camponoti-leonardi (nom. inval.)]|nr:hypothetical protein CP532_4191 [Ophiocordyceps camponoti-leonardi (nom. inval.)]
MAIDFIMPTPRTDPSQQSWRVLPPPTQQQQHQQPPRTDDRSHPIFQTSSSGPQISPQSISDTTSSSSGSNQTNLTSYPPSPTTATILTSLQGRPLYIPAVLRPCDEFPSRKFFRHSAAASSASVVPGSESVPSPLRRVNSNIINLAALGHRLTRRTSSDCAKAFEGDWNLDSYPEVTDLPTRIHWKPDQQSSVCDDPTCKRGFSYFIRRHHCRKCGNIFCDWHSSFFLPLDQDAAFNPRASLSRACNHCFQETKAAASQTKHEASGDSTVAPHHHHHHHHPPPVPTPMMNGRLTVAASCAADVAASVPRDWNWSTF